MKNIDDFRRNQIISHRGNLSGPNLLLENRPEYVIAASKHCFVEIDVWFKDGKYFLGHDQPSYEVTKLFLFNEKFLIHAKNLKTFLQLSRYTSIEVFFQQSDDIVLTTKARKLFHSRNEMFDAGHDFIWIDLEGKMQPDQIGDMNSLLTDYPFKYLESLRKSEIHIDLLVLDIDGVLTSGRKSYDTDGNVAHKDYNDKDFTAIKRFLAQGIKVIFLSGDRAVNESMAKIRGIDFYYAKNADGNIDKSEFVNELKHRYDATVLAYVGDDYYDLSIINLVDFSFCPSDAIVEIKSAVTKVLTSPGGDGVIAELFEYLMGSEPKAYAHDYLNGQK
jgi:3-deoxy-D-manno-octulosonate 8-phosphate phosphatase (KDO 8-P phosphatase)